MKKLFAILIMLTLTVPIFAENIPEQESADIPAETTEVTVSPAQYDLLPKDTVSETEANSSTAFTKEQFKKPVSKKKLAKKFIIAMLCVVGASVFLYGILKIYNIICNNIGIQITDDKNTKQSLDAPQDITEAVKSFVEKTKWEN